MTFNIIRLIEDIRNLKSLWIEDEISEEDFDNIIEELEISKKLLQKGDIHDKN